jgi:hypothetical protein
MLALLLISMLIQVDCFRETNTWDASYSSGGNYWSDYSNVDLNKDGIWDQLYVIDANNKDLYPLVNPWTLTPRKPSPIYGKGIWIWRLNEAEDGNVSKIIWRLKDVRVNWLAIKGGDGTNFWSHQCNHSLIAQFRNAGIKVLGWQYVYGDYPLEEANVANKILDVGVDGLIIDAESEYEGKPENAISYLEEIRKEHPESFVAYTTFPIIDYHKDSSNIWDDGYPSGGNFWSNHAVVDVKSGLYQNETGGDGIIDTPYVIDTNNKDRYPLAAPIYVFDASIWKGVTCNIDITSNSTVSNFQLNLAQKTVSFTVNGSEFTTGFCRVTIPNIIIQDMWHGNYTVLLNGKPWSFRNWTDNTNTYIYINYTHSEHEIVIIPEFPSPMILPLFMLTTSIATILLKKKRKTKPQLP